MTPDRNSTWQMHKMFQILLPAKRKCSRFLEVGREAAFFTLLAESRSRIILHNKELIKAQEQWLRSHAAQWTRLATIHHNRRPRPLEGIIRKCDTELLLLCFILLPYGLYLKCTVLNVVDGAKQFVLPELTKLFQTICPSWAQQTYSTVDHKLMMPRLFVGAQLQFTLDNQYTRPVCFPVASDNKMLNEYLWNSLFLIKWLF